MWLATKYGIYSIVQKQAPGKDEQSVYHVRARVRVDLENLLQATGLQHEIQEWPKADYHFRIIVDQQAALAIINHLAENIDYSNFKSKIGDTKDQRGKLHAYHEVWSVMARLQK